MKNKRPRTEEREKSFAKKENPRSGFGEKRREFDSKPSFKKREEGGAKFEEKKRPFGEKKTFSSERSFQRKDEKPERKSFSGERNFQRRDNTADSQPVRERKVFSDRPKASNDERPFKPFKKVDDSGRPTSNDRKFAFSPDKPRFQKNEPYKPFKKDKPNRFELKENQANASKGDAPNYDLERLKSRLPEKVQRKVQKEEKEAGKDELIRLNRYISNAGIASRRDADELIASGQITVNGKVVSEMGYKVKPTDVVKYGKKILNREKLVYVLLNKPKDFITTTEDPNERKTVMDLVKNACPERIYPVGRLDRNTTGLLLLTNDGELAEKLSHPSNEIKKIYQVELNKPISDEDFDKISNGIELEDGFIKPDELAIVTPDAEVVGIKIHSGKNRIVRRIFESLGYEVMKLDRTTYAGLDKKDLPRSKWRFLTEKEVIRLKYML
ncbi:MULTISPECIES: pseudouridine synthase [Emticicia]|uniref:pseudouridine synthase n=1 Tax=Emticicia TaxID=312278 RepID=UPI0007D89882|nr:MULTISPECIES: pseudouridine synthase [Emticicia]